MTRVRHLRKNSTRHERILWRHLRNRQLQGWKFRRQHPVDRYVIDFYCPEAHLAIELDGGGNNLVSAGATKKTLTLIISLCAKGEAEACRRLRAKTDLNASSLRWPQSAR